VKFADPTFTAKGERRAAVSFGGLRTLWANTGTLCNITCASCYIESSPRNDRLAYLTLEDLRTALDEARGATLEEVGFTGGEPFLNRELPAMLRLVLDRGLRAIVLTNAMKPMRNHAEALLALCHPGLTIRVSLDHHAAALHDRERGAGSFGNPSRGCAGWRPTASTCTSPRARPSAGKGRRRCARASPASSPSTPSRWTPPTPSR
jgi:sulfatase maturation enzyme AslB (radical SAM superfamily)